MKIYTRGGDKGETSLIGAGRVSKDDPRINAYGTVDELNACVGLVRSAWASGPIDGILAEIQSDLFDIGAQLAASENDSRFPGASPDRIEALEREIDRMEEMLEPLRNFILPGGSEAAARLHLARTICRRAERLIVGLERNDLERTLAWMNRLSDFFFVAARFANHDAGVQDVAWKKRG